MENKTLKARMIERQLRTQIAKDMQLATVFEVVCKATGRTAEELRSPSRERRLYEPRQIFCYLTSKMNKQFTVEEVGQMINRDHATVLHSRRTMEGYLSIDQNMRRKVQAIADMLGLETRKMSNTDKGEALELLEARISQLNTWLIIHAHNPFRVKVVEDVRDLERQRTALLAELDNQTNQSI